MTKIFNSYFILLIFIGLIVIDQMNIVSSSIINKRDVNGKKKTVENGGKKIKITTIKPTTINPTTEDKKHIDYIYTN
uniref:Uncharacterized protein n=1 Tax=Meloidogyne enterolobii TaxID=390850 RepID=A0A6V7WG36_MELEN|nr:unnamed protein product [Meloidogyne enterolobii]